MKINLLSLLIILTSFSVFSQKIEVTGQIKDKDGIETPYASIVFKSVTGQNNIFGTLGDDNGFFAIELVKDNYSVEVSVVGVQPKVFALDLTKSKKGKDLGIISVSTEVALDEVVVKGNKATYKIDLDKKVYNVSQDIVAKGGTLADVMQNLPSVQAEAGGNVSIRGDPNVRILIDGKPSGLASSADLFGTIPASSIERVEVITNPSSKYSAQGTAGIINVVLNKGKKKRFSSSIEIFTGYRLTSGFNGNVAQSGENGSWYVNAGIGYSEPKAVNDIFLQAPNDIPNTTDQESDRIREQYYYLINVGGTKDFNEKNSISGSITYRGAQSDNNNTTLYEDFNNGVLLATSNRKEKEEEADNFAQGNLNYDLGFSKDGHKLNINISGELTKDGEEAVINAQETFPMIQALNQDNITNDGERSRYVVSLDYVLPFKNKSNIELGYRSDFSSIENDFSVERLQDGQTVIVPEFTDKTLYGEKVHAFYGQFFKTINKFSIKLGLRTEISDIDITSKTNNFTNKKNYTDLFPSSFFTYEFNEKDKLQLSLSRRINRPGSRIIVPFSTFTDERNIFVGNPDINPSYIFVSELSYITEVSNKLSLYPTLYYRKTTDEMELYVEKQQITIGNDTQEIFTSTIANIGDYTTYGVEIGVSYKPFNWWNMYGEVLFNGFKQRGSFKGASFDGDGVLVSGRYNTDLNLFKTMKLQIQNYYRGPIETGQYRRKGFYGMNIGISNDIFKGNGTIAFNVRDVFNSDIRKITTFGEDFTRDLEFQYRVRQITLSLTYKFNQKKYKGKKGSQYDDYESIR